MKCPNCGSTNIEKHPVSINEYDIEGAIAGDINPFGFVAALAKKASDALNNRKRYICNNCGELFYD